VDFQSGEGDFTGLLINHLRRLPYRYDLAVLADIVNFRRRLRSFATLP